MKTKKILAGIISMSLAFSSASGMVFASDAEKSVYDTISDYYAEGLNNEEILEKLDPDLGIEVWLKVKEDSEFNIYEYKYIPDMKSPEENTYAVSIKVCELKDIINEEWYSSFEFINFDKTTIDSKNDSINEFIKNMNSDYNMNADVLHIGIEWNYDLTETEVKEYIQPESKLLSYFRLENGYNYSALDIPKCEAEKYLEMYKAGIINMIVCTSEPESLDIEYGAAIDKNSYKYEYADMLMNVFEDDSKTDCLIEMEAGYNFDESQYSELIVCKTSAKDKYYVKGLVGEIKKICNDGKIVSIEKAPEGYRFIYSSNESENVPLIIVWKDEESARKILSDEPNFFKLSDYIYKDGICTKIKVSKEEAVKFLEVYETTDSIIAVLGDPEPQPSYNDKVVVYGDADQNGIVDVTDLTMMSQYLLKDIELTADQIACSDVNIDGEINLQDIALLKQYIMHDDVKLGVSLKSGSKLDPIDKTDYSKIERNESAIIEGFSGAREATDEQMAASKNQLDKGSVQ